jgi:20S proteasome alpha/beta subunit
MDKIFTSPGSFSPNGRLCQVEYALEAVENSNDLIVIQTVNGFIIGTEIKKDTEIEDDKKYPRNIFLIPDLKLNSKKLLKLPTRTTQKIQ